MIDVMPHSIESERALLGAAMQWPDRVLTELSALGLQGYHFYRPEHQQLFGMLLEMEREGEPIEVTNIAETVVRSGRAGDFGGVAYVVELPDHCPSAGSAMHYARRIIADERRRTLIDAADDVRRLAVEGTQDPTDVADIAVGRILAGHDAVSVGGWVPIGETLRLVVDEAEASFANPEARRAGVSTGFRELDSKIGGLFPGDLVVLAGRPAMGKSALAMQIAEHVAQSDGPVGVFSLEMPRDDLARRMACVRASVNVQAMRTQRLSRVELDRLQRSLKTKIPRLFVDDKAGLTISQISARARRLARQEGTLALIVLDYLQIVGEELGPRNNREREVAHMSTQAKKLAKDLGCPVLLLSQLNRSVESRKDKRPIMSDLRESGAVEQDADVCMFAFRPEYYWPNDSKYIGMAEVIIAKQRNGPTGSVDLHFEGQFTRFRDLTAAEIDHQRKMR